MRCASSGVRVTRREPFSAGASTDDWRGLPMNQGKHPWRAGSNNYNSGFWQLVGGNRVRGRGVVEWRFYAENFSRTAPDVAFAAIAAVNLRDR